MPDARTAVEKTVPTSLKLPAGLKVQIDDLARKAGVSAHAFMVNALSESTQRAQLRAQFAQDAQEALNGMVQTGLGHDWDEAKAYLKARAQDRNTPRPPLRPI